MAKKEQYKIEYYTWTETIDRYFSNDWRLWLYGSMTRKEAVDVAKELVSLYIGPDEDKYKVFDNEIADYSDHGCYREDNWSGDADGIRVRVVPY